MVKIHKDKVEKVDMVKKCAIFIVFGKIKYFQKFLFLQS